MLLKTGVHLLWSMGFCIFCIVAVWNENPQISSFQKAPATDFLTEEHKRRGIQLTIMGTDKLRFLSGGTLTNLTDVSLGDVAFLDWIVQNELFKIAQKNNVWFVKKKKMCQFGKLCRTRVNLEARTWVLAGIETEFCRNIPPNLLAGLSVSALPLATKPYFVLLIIYFFGWDWQHARSSGRRCGRRGHALSALLSAPSSQRGSGSSQTTSDIHRFLF